MEPELISTAEAIALLPAKKAFESNILPLSIDAGYFHVALCNANDLKLLNELSFYTGLKIKPVEVPLEFIIQKLKKIYSESETKSGDLKNGDNGNDNPAAELSNIEFVNEIISNAVKSNASDIHLEGYENSFRIRYRIDGHLREIYSLPKAKGLPVASRLKVMANLDIAEKRRPQDGRITFRAPGKNIDIRVSTLPVNFGEKIVLRILDKSHVELDLNKLGLSSPQYQLLKTKLSLPYGMILVTGPTGSGKTTTLYAALKLIHSIEKNILTVEDPIEYNIEGINQCSVKPDIGFDFANALRSFLRQDPDVIMVGEIRDRETAEIAIRASLTGHLVLSTLHTNDSVSAISRLIDMGIEPFLVSSSVKLIVAQRLVRTLCDCKTESLNTKLQGFEKIERMFAKKGCEKCGYVGYKGRTAISELLEINEDIAELISRSASQREIKENARKYGFMTLKESGIEKINTGITSFEEVLRETML